MAPSDALLRTLAAVPPGARVVDAASGAGRHLVPLAQLGFDVHGFAVDPTPARAALAEVLGEEEAAARVRRAAPDALDLADASTSAAFRFSTSATTTQSAEADGRAHAVYRKAGGVG